MFIFYKVFENLIYMIMGILDRIFCILDVFGFFIVIRFLFIELFLFFMVIGD